MQLQAGCLSVSNDLTDIISCTQAASAPCASGVLVDGNSIMLSLAADTPEAEMAVTTDVLAASWPQRLNDSRSCYD